MKTDFGNHITFFSRGMEPVWQIKNEMKLNTLDAVEYRIWLAANKT